MSEYELTTLVFELFRDMDSMIQFWIQATFAVVVAVFVAGDRLSRWMRVVIAALYLIASVQAGARWILLVSRTTAFRERMRAEGFSDIPTDPVLVGAVTNLIMVIYVGGVVATVYFVARPRVGRSPEWVPRAGERSAKVCASPSKAGPDMDEPSPAHREEK